MNPLIEFCVTNLADGSQEVKEKLEKDPDLDVQEWGCLNHCGMCAIKNYALVEGQRIFANSPDELLEKIYEYLEEEELI
ncbi:MULTISPECIES: YuzB family protein [Salimicrobium]|uniref:F-box domain-containing protein n=3 Tax=Salimicrobium TaxID=351195 RepID=K2HBU1_9BACI|nr:MULTISPECIES: YuzB family protein [Salimicrobium]AKG04004.1 hypothetical protein AAV35_003830 [Salimicrobium jeotgali]EKE33045.1 hypothetical protein MJ3_01055 [Salimicrobium jeotgali]MBM7694961.1 uncharacterized protein YuzB (UPF0349 family) [Salimicrobium jeotgali]SDY01523.1 Uncharacterized protein YuzB, UPF0349 family [Salimicrobium album]SIS72034.1 Uncharacterized protein YuzB, UPF0349 family [Salimicrobium salexigens]